MEIKPIRNNMDYETASYEALPDNQFSEEQTLEQIMEQADTEAQGLNHEYIGTEHILLGLILGLWEGFKEKDKHHLLERGGRLLGLIALFMLTGILVDFLPNGFMTPAIALLTVGTVFLAWSLGKIGVIIAPIELIGLVGNVLSYLRIAAIGLSSVYLALVASEIAGMVGSIVIGVIIAVLLHALNLVLGTFSPTIQSLRLHYVEFFRNFYQGGGRLYQPYRLRIPQRE